MNRSCLPPARRLCCTALCCAVSRYAAHAVQVVCRDIRYYVPDPAKGASPGVVAPESGDKEIAGKLELLKVGRGGGQEEAESLACCGRVKGAGLPAPLLQLACPGQAAARQLWVHTSATLSPRPAPPRPHCVCVSVHGAGD